MYTVESLILNLKPDKHVDLGGRLFLSERALRILVIGPSQFFKAWENLEANITKRSLSQTGLLNPHLHLGFTNKFKLARNRRNR